MPHQNSLQMTMFQIFGKETPKSSDLGNGLIPATLKEPTFCTKSGVRLLGPSTVPLKENSDHLCKMTPPQHSSAARPQNSMVPRVLSAFAGRSFGNGLAVSSASTKTKLWGKHDGRQGLWHTAIQLVNKHANTFTTLNWTSCLRTELFYFILALNAKIQISLDFRTHRLM